MSLWIRLCNHTYIHTYTYTRYDCREFDVHAVTHPYLLHHSSPLVQPNPTVVKTTHNTRDQESSAA